MRQAKQAHIPYAVTSRSFVKGETGPMEILLTFRSQKADLLILPGGE